MLLLHLLSTTPRLLSLCSVPLVNDISPPQPVLADLFELDTTAVHAVVSFHFTTSHPAFFAHVMWFPGEQDDHHGGVDGFSGPAEPVHCYAPIRAEQAAEHRTSALGQGGKNLFLSISFPFSFR